MIAWEVYTIGTNLHPDYFHIITDRYTFPNQWWIIIMCSWMWSCVRSSVPKQRWWRCIYKFYQDEILFLGLSSFESYSHWSLNILTTLPSMKVHITSIYSLDFCTHDERPKNEYFPTWVKKQFSCLSQTLCLMDQNFFLFRTCQRWEDIWLCLFRWCEYMGRLYYLSCLPPACCACVQFLIIFSFPTLTGSGCWDRFA